MQTIKAFISGCAGTVLTAAEENFFATERPWGLILFRRNCASPEQIASLTARFRHLVGRKDAPVLIDQEGGRVQRLGPPLTHWRKYPPARALGELFARNPLMALRTARSLGRLMAEDMAACGITVDCLPVLDLPRVGSHDVIGDRAYAVKPETVAALARAHSEGLMAGGVLPVMKHIPGHGRAQADSHHELPVVHASRGELEEWDFLPFAAYADCPMAMTAHVVFTALDADAPATLSRKVVNGVIRRDIGFTGLLMTDDLSMKALSGSMREKAAAAHAAGCDMLLHCNGDLAEMQELAAAARPLAGKAMARAKAALRRLRKPASFDREAALRHWQAITSA